MQCSCSRRSILTKWCSHKEKNGEDDDAEHVNPNQHNIIDFNFGHPVSHPTKMPERFSRAVKIANLRPS